MVVTARNITGQVVFTGSANIAANGRADFDIHSVVGANTFGSITLTHNGPYSAIRAALAEYNAALQLQGRDRLTPRDRED